MKPAAVQSKTQGFMFYAAIVMFAALGGYTGSLLQDRDEPVLMYVAEAVNPVVNAGSQLRVRYNLLRKRSCEVEVDRFIIDAARTRHILPDIRIGRGMPVGPDDYTVLIDIPLETPPGPATYRTVTNYICNPSHMVSPIPGGTRDIAFLVK